MTKKDLDFMGILDLNERATDAPVPWEVLEWQWLAHGYGTSEELAFLAFYWVQDGSIAKRDTGYSRRLTHEEDNAWRRKNGMPEHPGSHYVV